MLLYYKISLNVKKFLILRDNFEFFYPAGAILESSKPNNRFTIWNFSPSKVKYDVVGLFSSSFKGMFNGRSTISSWTLHLPSFVSHDKIGSFSIWNMRWWN